MGISEFDDAYEDDEEGPPASEREVLRLGEAILSAPIRALEPRRARTLPESATIREAIRLMLAEGIGAVLVVREGRPVGIFTERDVLRSAARAAMDQDRPLSDAMTLDPQTLTLDAGIAFALNRMIIGGFRHIPIVDDAGRALAVLSQREVVAFIVSQLPGRVLNLPPEPDLEARSEDGG